MEDGWGNFKMKTVSSCLQQLKITKTLFLKLLTVGYWIEINSPARNCSSTLSSCHLSCQQQHWVTVGPHTIEWCLYVMTPRLKPDYPKACDVTRPRPCLVISDHLGVIRGHSFPWVQWSHWLPLLHGRLWPALSPCSCHLELTHHRESTVPTT